MGKYNLQKQILKQNIYFIFKVNFLEKKPKQNNYFQEISFIYLFGTDEKLTFGVSRGIYLIVLILACMISFG